MLNQKLEMQLELPRQFRAALEILEADAELKVKCFPFVDFTGRRINWNEIFKKDLSSGQRAALVWAKALFQGRRPANVDPFDRAFSMDANMRRAVVKALLRSTGE